MTGRSTEKVIASISRAPRGEVSARLRSVHVRTEDRSMSLRFVFEGIPGESESDPIGAIGTEVAADLADASVPQELIVRTERSVPSQDGWHTAYGGKGITLVR